MTEEVVSSTITTTNNNNNKSPINDNIVNQPQFVVKEKKKQGAFSFLKAASLKLRRRSLDLKQQKFSPEAVPPDDSKGENWKKLVGSMRPLHLQDNQSPPSPHDPLPPPVKSTSLPVEFSEHFSSPYSPSPSTSSVGTMSQYASANNLQELYGENNINDDNEEEEDPDQVFDAIGGDDMIDAKAENFIAQFYEQMRLQK
ncbi:uncharacterized protein LOC129881799 [Solanum dulcamara]|uniref:uncharacterized protein LOC129881799 n=1 Tax=Solanum dulcamara TaxID=45834 RepID=UPI0024860F4C|nr:uncharacterized protein LOC129881799 [Solanum dulcamara]